MRFLRDRETERDMVRQRETLCMCVFVHALMSGSRMARWRGREVER